MFRALLVTEDPLNADELRRDLHEAGVDVVAECDPAALAQLAVRLAADLVITTSTSPSSLLFEAGRILETVAPCPFIVFTSDGDHAKIEQASVSGVHAYVVDGYAKHRLLSIIQVARARFRHGQVLKEELVGLSQRFEERKLVDRAKGALMRSRGITEEEAFELLRSLAMRSRQRIGVVARSVIDRSRAGEAINRAGQLRMLSQRLTLCYARVLVGLRADEAALIVADCVARVEANLGILRKAISTQGYGDLVDRVTASWVAVRTICAAPPDRAQLVMLDARAGTMLDDAEALTEFLETSGLVSSLHVINVAGRQRMLGQRIAKLCFLLAVEPSATQLAELREAASAFQASLATLGNLPLSTDAIRNELGSATRAWQQLEGALAAITEQSALALIADASEHLLEASERLTDLYEQAMQVLIGDTMGRMR